MFVSNNPENRHTCFFSSASHEYTHLESEFNSFFEVSYSFRFVDVCTSFQLCSCIYIYEYNMCVYVYMYHRLLCASLVQSIYLFIIPFPFAFDRNAISGIEVLEFVWINTNLCFHFHSIYFTHLSLDNRFFYSQPHIVNDYVRRSFNFVLSCQSPKCPYKLQHFCLTLLLKQRFEVNLLPKMNA